MSPSPPRRPVRALPNTRRAAAAAGALLAAASLAGALLLPSSARALGPRDRHLSDVRHGISVEAPAGWSLSQRSGYGDTVTVLLHPDGGRISVTAAPTTAADGRALFAENQKGLLAQKMQPAPPQAGPRGFTSVDIMVPGRSDRLRQLYLVRPTPQGKQAVILTLVCRDSLFAELTSALTFVAERLELDDPEPPAASVGPRAYNGGAGGSGPPVPGRARYAAALAAPPSDKPMDTAALGLGGRPGITPPDLRATGGSGGQLRSGHGDRKTGP